MVLSLTTHNHGFIFLQLMVEVVAYVPSGGNVSVGDIVNIGASVKVDSDRLWVGQQQLTVCDTYDPVMASFTYFLNVFLRINVLFLNHWYPCFGFLVTSPLGFKFRVGSALFAFCGGECTSTFLK